MFGILILLSMDLLLNNLLNSWTSIVVVSLRHSSHMRCGLASLEVLSFVKSILVLRA